VESLELDGVDCCCLSSHSTFSTRFTTVFNKDVISRKADITSGSPGSCCTEGGGVTNAPYRWFEGVCHYQLKYLNAQYQRTTFSEVDAVYQYFHDNYQKEAQGLPAGVYGFLFFAANKTCPEIDNRGNVLYQIQKSNLFGARLPFCPRQTWQVSSC